MKVAFAIVLSLAFAFVSCDDLELTQSDFDRILSSEDLARSAAVCIVEFHANCSPKLQKLSVNAPDILRSNFKCNNCAIYEDNLLSLKAKYPAIYNQLMTGLNARMG
ncbi:UNVERIFIED_CONTAM: hypothetical protein RMT77_019519 [Armadillidium vulgare]